MDLVREIWMNRNALDNGGYFMMNDTESRVPRIELHCHLDGSLSQGCIEELLGRTVRKEELQVAPDCRDLAEYLEKFDLPLQCLQTPAGLKRAGYDFMKTAADDKLRYVEVRFAPLLSCNNGMKTEEVIESVLEGMKLGREESGIEYGVIVCAMRHHSEEENLGMIKAAREFLGYGVCAADLAGNEAAFPMSGFRNLFCEVKKMGMPFTIHAGECGSVENILDAVECGAQRIGHGIAMRGNREAMEIFRRKHIGIEMCPISNLQTKAVKNMAEYPIREFLDQGLCVTINTDNRTVSGTSMEKEIAFVRENYGITEEEIIRMMRNAVDAAFASDQVKERIIF